MNTITAKELRDNLGDIAKRVSGGEHIRVSYRHKELFELKPISDLPAEKSTNTPGLDAFLALKPKPSIHDPNKPIKQIYHELLEEKYGGR